MIQIKPDSVPPVLLQYTAQTDFLTKAVDEALHPLGLHAFLTSGMEGTHTRDSKHYRGEAVDFRKVWTAAQETVFLQRLTKQLGTRGKYILESDHLHVETTEAF